MFAQDECSFVSLRDVDRAMIVFKYFYDKMNLFGPLMEKWANDHKDENKEIKILSQVRLLFYILKSIVALHYYLLIL